MNRRATKVLDELAGREPGQDEKTRSTVWYGRWHRLAANLLKFVDRPTARRILLLVFDLVEESRGHKHAHTAASSQRALELVCRERKLK
jgi:hypothetical protein